jgi:sugar phosphate isomerase/epimerase
VFNHDFLSIIEMIRNVYNVSLITIHPQKGDSIAAMAKLEEYGRSIEDLGVTLAYENFPSSVGKRKWVYLPREMHSRFNLPFLKLTFDTSHLDNPAECIEEFDVVADKVAVIHLSDNDGKSQHQPLGTGNVPYKQFLRYLKDMDFSGPVVIEYMPEYEAELIADVDKLVAL